MKRMNRVPLIRRSILAALLLLALALLTSGCGEEVPTATPKPLVTLRPTFTPTVEASPVLKTETPKPQAATQPPQPSDTPTEEVSPVPGDTQTPMILTATPSLAAPSKTPTRQPATATPGKLVRMESPGYSMQAFLWWRPEVAQRDLEAIRDAGFGWVKQAFAWRDIEGKVKGQYDWSVTDRIVDQVQSVGLKLIVRLDSEPTWASGQSYPNAQEILMAPPRNLQDLAGFCSALAARYRGRIAAYQVWNEPNLAREWGGQAPSPSGYVALLKVCYQAIKAADPSAIVISAGMAPTTRNDAVAMPDTKFLHQMYAAGAKPYFDALGAHGAGYKAPPEMDPGQVATDPNYYNVGDPTCSDGVSCRVYCFRHVEDLHQVMVDNGDTNKQVVVLEFGWTMDPRTDSPYHWHAITEQQQAAYLVGAYQYAKQNWQPWIGVMSLIYMPNIDWTQDDEQYWWSIAIPNYPQLYSYQSYRDLKAMPK